MEKCQKIAETVETPEQDLHVAAFELAGRTCAIPSANVREVLFMPALARPPGLPAILEGILNLGGVAVPVVKLDRLFGLPERVAGLYTPIIVLRSQNPLALLVDKAARY